MDAHSTLTLNTGDSMPVTGFGTWQLNGDDALGAVTTALKQGYRMIDTAGNYGNQKQVGQAIKKSGLNRQEIFVVTKIESNQDAYTATKANLLELDLDYADLILIHWPPGEDAGVELWEGLIRARDEGLAVTIGVSNYSSEQIEELVEATDEVPVVNQIEWSPFGHSLNMLDWTEENEVIIQAYSTLTRTNRLDNEALQQLADKYDKSPAQLIIRWDLQHGVVPVVKASSQAHIIENLDVFDFELEEDDMTTLDNLNEQYSVLGHRPGYI